MADSGSAARSPQPGAILRVEADSGADDSDVAPLVGRLRSRTNNPQRCQEGGGRLHSLRSRSPTPPPYHPSPNPWHVTRRRLAVRRRTALLNQRLRSHQFPTFAFNSSKKFSTIRKRLGLRRRGGLAAYVAEVGLRR